MCDFHRRCFRGCWFLALPITSKGLDEAGRTKSNVEPIGNCIDDDRESFVVLELHRLPEKVTEDQRKELTVEEVLVDAHLSDLRF